MRDISNVSSLNTATHGLARSDEGPVEADERFPFRFDSVPSHHTRYLGINELWQKKRQLPAKLPANGELDETRVILVHHSAKTLVVLADGRFAASDC